jgi:hypothetical protein
MPQDENTGEGSADSRDGLTAVEDDELRQLTWFSSVGDLSERAVNRLWQLVGQDRRGKVRDPRPNPGAPEDDEMPTRLPPLEMDRTASSTCPNCGALLRYEDRARNQ